MFLLLGDHAGNAVPQRLGDLGLPPAELVRHVAIDLGVAELGARLARMLDAPFLEQHYSRLVIDCNRALDDPGSILAVSDGTAVPGNANLPDQERSARIAAIHAPYHRAIDDVLARRDAAGERTILVALHSFTPALADGQARPWQVGVLHGGGEERFALAVLEALRGMPGLVVGDNEPYRMDGTDHTVPAHAFAAGRAYVEIEVRQDELASESGQAAIAAILHDALSQAAQACIGTAA